MEYDTGAPFGGGPQDDGTAQLDGTGQPDVIGTEAARGSRRRKGMAVAAGAVILVGGGGAAALAASTSPSPGPTAPGTSGSEGTGPEATRPAPGTEGAPGRMGGRGGAGLLGGGALHGQLTVRGSGGAYEDVLVQRGTVTAVSPTSLAVRSADGYSHTYTLNASTEIDGKKGDTSSLAVNDTVGVLAGSDSTARYVVERRAGRLGGERGPMPGGAPNGEGWSPHGLPGGPGREGVAPGAPATPNSSTPGGLDREQAAPGQGGTDT